MAFLEFLAVVIVILLILILIKLYKKLEPQKQEEGMANQLLLDRLEKIEKTMGTKAEEDTKRQDKLMKCVEENISTFTRTIHGTKRRGKVGEAIVNYCGLKHHSV